MRGRFTGILAATFAALAANAAAAADVPVEYALKGTYLYKFLPFVDWPNAAPNAPLTVCILGHDPFGAVLDKAAADQHADARPVVVRRVDTPEAAAPCQVVFVGIADAPGESAALSAFQNKPVLTVTDSGAPVPGMVSFVIDNNHVRFDIDDAAAAKSGLAISSKLLSLARAVKPRGGAL